MKQRGGGSVGVEALWEALWGALSLRWTHYLGVAVYAS